MRESRDYESSGIPKLFHIFHGEVASLQAYGAFIKIPGCRKQGLVHKSQMSNGRVDDPSEMLAKGEKVYCKVISMEGDGEKISLSMKVVNQSSGKDLDPNNVQSNQDEKKRRQWNNHGRGRIELGAELNTTCRRCGVRGHLAIDCFSRKGDRNYDLVPDLDKMTNGSSDDDLSDSSNKKKKRKKDKKKKDKRKKSKKRRHSSSSSDSGDSDSDDRQQKKSKQDAKGKGDREQRPEDDYNSSDNGASKSRYKAAPRPSGQFSPTDQRKESGGNIVAKGVGRGAEGCGSDSEEDWGAKGRGKKGAEAASYSGDRESRKDQRGREKGRESPERGGARKDFSFYGSQDKEKKFSPAERKARSRSSSDSSGDRGKVGGRGGGQQDGDKRGNRNSDSWDDRKKDEDKVSPNNSFRDRPKSGSRWDGGSNRSGGRNDSFGDTSKEEDRRRDSPDRKDRRQDFAGGYRGRRDDDRGGGGGGRDDRNYNDGGDGQWRRNNNRRGGGFAQRGWGGGGRGYGDRGRDRRFSGGRDGQGRGSQWKPQESGRQARRSRSSSSRSRSRSSSSSARG
ncbi:unnamed protein product [Lymnaea stagnalis]|uniref:Zinc finger CCHC domain-containing protein 17 n=1 Tax=Lymnaea stagnalis TaxID=6523 RepID=A0AAV2IPB2_LYMST